MKNYRLLVPIFANSNIVISEKVERDGFIFQPAKNGDDKGIIETTTSDEEEKYRKIEEIKNFTALISLEISEKENSNFFIYIGEPTFFNQETYGISTDGEKTPLFLAIGKEETCLTKDFILQCFDKYRLISKNEVITNALRWYNFGKFSQEDGDSIICFITSLEAISGKPKIKDPEWIKELERVKSITMKQSNINRDLKQRLVNSIENLKYASFIDKMRELTNELTDEVYNYLLKEAKELNLINSFDKDIIVDLLGKIYSDRGKILHSGKQSVENISKKRQWLEIYTRKVLLSKLEYANLTRKNNSKL